MLCDLHNYVVTVWYKHISYLMTWRNTRALRYGLAHLFNIFPLWYCFNRIYCFSAFLLYRYNWMVPGHIRFLNTFGIPVMSGCFAIYLSVWRCIRYTCQCKDVFRYTCPCAIVSTWAMEYWQCFVYFSHLVWCTISIISIWSCLFFVGCKNRLQITAGNS